jgi:homoaconitase/3-isopropylmalate dehydratase large subunit
MMRGIAGFDERVSDGIGIENGEAHLSQHGAYGAFAAGDAASDPKTKHK